MKQNLLKLKSWRLRCISHRCYFPSYFLHCRCLCTERRRSSSSAMIAVEQFSFVFDPTTYAFTNYERLITRVYNLLICFIRFLKISIFWRVSFSFSFSNVTNQFLWFCEKRLMNLQGLMKNYTLIARFTEDQSFTWRFESIKNGRTAITSKKRYFGTLLGDLYS